MQKALKTEEDKAAFNAKYNECKDMDSAAIQQKFFGRLHEGQVFTKELQFFDRKTGAVQSVSDSLAIQKVTASSYSKQESYLASNMVLLPGMTSYESLCSLAESGNYVNCEEVNRPKHSAGESKNENNEPSFEFAEDADFIDDTVFEVTPDRFNLKNIMT